MTLHLKNHHLQNCKYWIDRYSNLLGLLFAFVILFVMVFPVALPVAAATASDQSGINKNYWSIQSADDPMLFDYMSNRSISLDFSNNPHIAFGGDHLYYMFYDGSQWNFVVVDPSNGVGLFASLALDSSDHPHISYYDSVHGALKYAYYDGATWFITTVDQYALSSAGDSNNPEAVLGTSNRYVGERRWRSSPPVSPEIAMIQQPYHPFQT